MEKVNEHPSITKERLEWGDKFIKYDDCDRKSCRKCKKLFSVHYYVEDLQGSSDNVMKWNFYNDEVDDTLCSLCIYKMTSIEYNAMKESVLKKRQEEKRKSDEEKIKWERANTRYAKCLVCQSSNIPYVHRHYSYVYDGPESCESCRSFISSGKLLMSFIDKNYPQLWQEFIKWKQSQ